jgi:hypothetical protein
MKSWKKAALALAAAGVLSAQAYASEVQVDQLPVVSFSQAEVHAMFEPADKPMEIVALSSVEMKETEGAWVFNAFGGLAGMYGSGYGYLAGGGRNPYGFAVSALAGTAGGFFSPVTGVRSGLMTFGGAFASSGIGTWGSSRF